MNRVKRKIGKKMKEPVLNKSNKKKDIKTKEDYESMSVDDFLSQDFNDPEVEYSKNDSDSVSDIDLDSELKKGDNKNEYYDELDESDDQDEDSVENLEEYELKHKESLAKLKETDPEFYKFLEENDKQLLNFNVFDDGDDIAEGGSQLHIPDTNLEVASDESDFEDGDEEVSEGTITLKILKQWQNDLRNDKSHKTLGEVAQAFHAALLTVSPDAEAASSYKVEGSAVFNAVIQLCVLEFGPAIRRYLGLKTGSKQLPHKCKKFTKVKNLLKSYFQDILKLLSGVASANIQTVLLKHLHYMSSMLISFPHYSKSILKEVVSIWGKAEEGVRVIAFLCILRITRNNQVGLLDTALKSMYMIYVKNSKFVSATTLAGINFMRRSLVEMFALDLNFAYQHVFLYIRQLAIHLRNAITIKKKENTQAVYNWQFVNSLKLWGNLLCATSDKPQLQQLVYPLIQVCLGTIKLVPTAQYYPLRFHITQILMELSRDGGVFIPILPFFLEVLNTYDFNKKHQRVSMKPLQFTFILRLSKSQLGENGFKDTLIDTVYSQLLEYMAQQSHSIAFPELSIVSRIQIKEFIKKCKNANYVRKIKQALEKIEQNAQFIENERTKISYNLTDTKQIKGWENQMKNKGTPLSTYYESWTKVRDQNKRKEISNNDELGNYDLPILKKSIKKTAEPKDKNKGSVELFPSDSEEETEMGIKRKRGKRGGKGNKVVNHSGPINDDGKKDIIEDIDIDDW